MNEIYPPKARSERAGGGKGLQWGGGSVTIMKTHPGRRSFPGERGFRPGTGGGRFGFALMERIGMGATPPGNLARIFP